MKRFYIPTEIITGVGCFAELGRVAERYGQRTLLVCGRTAMRKSGILDRAVTYLRQAGLEVQVYDAVAGEPTLDVVEGGVELARKEKIQVIIGLGGGSAVDAAKAIAGLVNQAGTVQEYHKGRAPEDPGLPWIAVPTTAGTGAEVTKNAVLTDPERRVKASIRSDDWFARLALLDPELTIPMPPAVTASTGSDALCQAIESYVSIGAGPVTDALASEATARIGRSLARAYEDGEDVEARADMLYGSLLAGLALTNARLGGVHGMAHPLGLRYHIPHGTVCGLLLPYVMEYNLEYATAKYATVARLLGVDTSDMDEQESAATSVEVVWDILGVIDIPAHLAQFGVRQEDFPTIIAESLPSGSLKHNPRPLGEEDVRYILTQAL
jgi:alcohol dehydrogenase class IV